MKFKKADIKKTINETKLINPDELGIYTKTNINKRHCFLLDKSVDALENILKTIEIGNESALKIISYSGGFASISFIKHIAENEIIEYLFASTLRVGEKQLEILDELKHKSKIDKADFIIGGIMKSDKDSKYDYYNKFIDVCNKNSWRYCVVNNHSKIILMKTKNNFYVLETSSNLNENPKIEQFSFENNEELYNFYKMFFSKVMEASKNDR